jgi:UDP-glucose 4-epimerase
VVSLASKKVVVTGGAGFIGSNLAGIQEAKFIRGSITDLPLLKRAFIDVDCVFHQAALPSVQGSIENPIASNDANVDGTLKVLTAARDCGVNKVVFASSSAIYGDDPASPKREDMRPDPRSPYAVTKLVGEHYCKLFTEVYGLKTTCLRYFNVYGPRQNPKSQYAAVIPIFITRILSGRPPIIFGDGRQTRDFVFVKDVVKANILAMERDSAGIFNIACGRSVNLRELSSEIMGITGTRIEPVYAEPRVGDVKDSLADITVAKEWLGFWPGYDLGLGLKETVAGFRRAVEVTQLAV